MLYSWLLHTYNFCIMCSRVLIYCSIILLQPCTCSLKVKRYITYPKEKGGEKMYVYMIFPWCSLLLLLLISLLAIRQCWKAVIYFVVDNVWRLRYPSALSAFIDAWISARCDAISMLVFFTKTMAWGLFSTVIYFDATNYLVTCYCN